MKKTIAVLSFLVLPYQFASAQTSGPESYVPVTADSVLGIPNGTYVGTGELDQGGILPELDYTSTRTLSNGEIDAKTSAGIFGADLATVEAHLKVVAGENGQFNMYDLDRKDSSGQPEFAGKGSCTSNGCQFSVTVESGTLTLNETWVRTNNGFRVSSGAQTYHDVDSTYDGDFARQ